MSNLVYLNQKRRGKVNTVYPPIYSNVAMETPPLSFLSIIISLKPPFSFIVDFQLPFFEVARLGTNSMVGCSWLIMAAGVYSALQKSRRLHHTSYNIYIYVHGTPFFLCLILFTGLIGLNALIQSLHWALVPPYRMW